MKITNLIIVAIITLSMTVNAQTSVYKKAGEITIKDHKAVVAGTTLKDNDVFKISLFDIAKFDGHICGCNTAGFLMTKKVLEMLFPNEIPMCNSIKVSISTYNRDMIDAICLITGIRLNTGQYTKQGDEFVVDKSLAGVEGTTTLIFERKDNGKKIKVVLDKKILLTKEEMMAIKTIKPKIGKKTATDAEKKQFAEVTRSIVKKEITNMPDKAIVYTELN